MKPVSFPVAWCVAGVLAAGPVHAEVTALTDVHVVDVEHGRVIDNAVVLVDGDRIASVGTADEVPVPAGACTVPMHGRWLSPGLVNNHVHLSLKLPGPAGAALANETDPEQVLRMASNARRSLQSGVTTVRLTGEYHGNDFALKKAIIKGEVPGPRIESAGEIIVPTGGHGMLEADGPYALAKAVREQIKLGATWIKIAISGGISDSHGDIAAAPMTDEEMKVLIDVAHRNGVKVTAHNGSPVAAEQALKYGIDGFEHGYFLTDANLKQMKKQGVWLVPTAVVTDEGAMEFYKRIGSPDWYLDRVRSAGKRHFAMLQDAIKLKVNIALGTDQMPYEPNSGTTATIHEAELYVKAGMTALQALRTATTESARMLDREKDIGAIDVGRYADFVAMPQNPLDDISNLRALNFVMKGGQVVRDDLREAPACATSEI